MRRGSVPSSGYNRANDERLDIGVRRLPVLQVSGRETPGCANGSVQISYGKRHHLERTASLESGGSSSSEMEAFPGEERRPRRLSNHACSARPPSSSEALQSTPYRPVTR
jgi:hypothetical protein